jgi:hypothetical protein
MCSVVFGWMTISSMLYPGGSISFFGLNVPAWLAPWVSLVITRNLLMLIQLLHNCWTCILNVCVNRSIDSQCIIYWSCIRYCDWICHWISSIGLVYGLFIYLCTIMDHHMDGMESEKNKCITVIMLSNGSC